ncbi:unnamed protein product [Spirodela intermedia]|uniref:Uncharacterized protein n=1 Tax=Spirodela intermedia TaxID=51605 RepID=A0A7I8IVT0_SPIIN|nr:unnamed protein product [Spirodela intermedia]CAA6661890.1 unnamed protein product [Spirodela intermedia]
MADPSRRIICGIRALHARAVRRDPIFWFASGPQASVSPPFNGSGSVSSAVVPNAASDLGLSSFGAQMRSCSASGIWSRVFSLGGFPRSAPSNLASSRGFSARSDHGLRPYRNWRGNYSSGLQSSCCSVAGVAPASGARVICNSLKAAFSSSTKLKSHETIGRSFAAKPLIALSSVVSRYREVIGLQTEAFWKRNYLVLVGAAGVLLCIVLWRLMFGVASTFVGLSEGMAKYGFLALASAMVAFTGIYLRARFTVNPDKIYRMAMRKLNTSAGILEIMGAPLTGTDVRAYVMSGGGVRLKNFKLRFGGKRCFLIFPIKGSDRRGLVSVEAKKKKGQYDIKLLAVDIPMATGPDQRIFMIGDEAEYRVGGGLISELRDPIVKAMAAEKEFEDQDLREEEEDEKREIEEEERRRRVRW